MQLRCNRKYRKNGLPEKLPPPGPAIQFGLIDLIFDSLEIAAAVIYIHSGFLRTMLIMGALRTGYFKKLHRVLLTQMKNGYKRYPLL